MNILVVYQSVVDMGASIFMLLITIVKVDGTRMSRKSIYDQFVCLMWIGKQPLYYFLNESTYGILLTTLDRFIAVLYPLWYKNNVRTSINELCRLILIFLLQLQNVYCTLRPTSLRNTLEHLLLTR